MTLKLSNSSEAVIVDIGESESIHPKNKLDVGYRLSLAAREIAYGQDIVYSGPVYKSMKIENDKIRIIYSHTGSDFCIKDS